MSQVSYGVAYQEKWAARASRLQHDMHNTKEDLFLKDGRVSAIFTGKTNDSATHLHHLGKSD